MGQFTMYTSPAADQQTSMSGPYDHPARDVAVRLYTALGLILLTLMVYLFSLSLPNQDRHHAVYASLAKAFLFSDWTVAPEADAERRGLLTGPRQAVWQLAAGLAQNAPEGTLEWRGDDLLVHLATTSTLSTGLVSTLEQIAQVAKDGNISVQIETVGLHHGDRLRWAATLAAVIEQQGVNPAQIAAVSSIERGVPQIDAPVPTEATTLVALLALGAAL